ncbi:4-hydroxybenzoate octaprenyltransferase [Sabulicella glaciei]|uniref:4-hydroxybenzoate octaprenyltransferase n=1 Tax=Sabulicella glaciei TaxID=2984948 RepID=A0ABT3P0T1_9PROT|nr:4-hydroxybenzoate octaprenyltransferase [Roseococcus sp. MDT2-1-1]MCW8087980.1 4-hydroxybenzoate octaprenyltransferase [Roseococcus sp. MDT2-1-1]
MDMRPSAVLHGPVQGYTDIRREGWVARLPESWRPYALLMRADRPIGAWLLFLPGLWAIALHARDGWQGLWLTALFFVGAFVMRGAGCVVNDLWDRDIDRKVERTRGRPLAAGLVSPWQALWFLAGLCIVGLLVLLALPRFAWAVGVVSLVPVVLYPLAKRVTDYPQFVLGLTFGWGALLGTAASVEAITPAGWLLYAASIAWILGYDTIYAHQDREDDALVGIRSTALRFGERTRPFLLACYGVTLALLLLAGWVAGLSPLFALALLPAAILLWRQAQALDIHDPARCLALFRANREVGLLVALALLIGRW